MLIGFKAGWHVSISYSTCSPARLLVNHLKDQWVRLSGIHCWECRLQRFEAVLSLTLLGQLRSVGWPSENKNCEMPIHHLRVTCFSKYKKWLILSILKQNDSYVKVTKHHNIDVCICYNPFLPVYACIYLTLYTVKESNQSLSKYKCIMPALTEHQTFSPTSNLIYFNDLKSYLRTQTGQMRYWAKLTHYEQYASLVFISTDKYCTVNVTIWRIVVLFSVISDVFLKMCLLKKCSVQNLFCSIM